MSFGEKVLILLQERRMTQKELARLTDITEVSISRYINNSRLPKGDVIAKIASALGTTSDFLLNDKNITLKLPDRKNREKSDRFSLRLREDTRLADLSDEEQLLLFNFNQLESGARKNLLSFSNYLLYQEETGNNNDIS